MISFFNGRTRSLGGETSEVFAKMDVAFRGYLHLLKGAHLGVFLAIALPGNEDGWAWPSYATMARETGYSEDTIRRALAHLCKLEINGHRVLLRYQPKGQEGTFQSNRYLLFPSAEEVARYEGRGVAHLGAETGGGFNDRGGKTPPRPPWWEKPSSENPTTKKNHDKPEDDDNDNGHRPSDDLLTPGPDAGAGSQDGTPAPDPPAKPPRPTGRARSAAAGDDAVLGEVVRLYEAEVGAVTEGVMQRLLALVEEHGDLDVWQRAFDAVVGSNVRRLDYLEACLENDGQPKPEARVGPARGKRARPRAGRRSASATSTRHAGGLRGRVVSPEEMPQVEPEEPLPLPQMR